MIDWLFNGDAGTVPTNSSAVLLGVLLAFFSGHTVAWIYMITHTGLSYSKSFVNSLIVIPMIVSLVMMVLSNNLVTAFGMMAVFAIVRFRNILRDTLDTSYILCVLVIGMACGTMKYSTAVIALSMTSLIMLYLWYTSFGTRHRYDIILNLHWDRPSTEIPILQRMLGRHTLKLQCASQRANEDFAGTDISYRALLRDPERLDDLLQDLRGFPGVTRVTGLRAEEESEV